MLGLRAGLGRRTCALRARLQGLAGTFGITFERFTVARLLSYRDNERVSS